MAAKFWWVLAPLALYGLWLVLQALRGRLPTRFALNVHLSLLLMGYLLVTAGLGIFWVANQQLPVFDAHYLFGYTMLLLLGAHLYLNLPLIWRYFKRAPEKHAATPTLARVGKAFFLLLALLLALTLAWQLGQRQAQPTRLRANLASGPGAEGSATTFDLGTVLRYHEYSSESRQSVFARAVSVSWGEAPDDFKSYPDAQRIALPKWQGGGLGFDAALQGPRRGTSQGAERIELAQLGRILYLTAGITAQRGGSAWRAAPSSGGLFPAELYVAVRQDIKRRSSPVASSTEIELAAGLYHYEVQSETLERVAGPEALPSVQAGLSQSAPVSVIVAAIMARTGYKYRDRAYRYVAADVGHLLENLRLAGHTMGLHSVVLPAFDESALGAALGLDASKENVLAVMNLHLAEASQASPRFLVPPAATAAHGATGMIHQATSLQSVPPADAPTLSGPVITLPNTTALSTDVQTLIPKRRSQRRFSDKPLSLAQLAASLQHLQPNSQLSGALDLHLVVNRVQGLASGVYQYLPQQHALHLVRAGDVAAAAQSAALDQDVIGNAAVILLISARNELVLREGARAYRHMFLEAGMVGQRWLLAAVAQGLGACPVGAFYDDEAARLIGLDAQKHWVLHFAALGLP
jgi:SagB-type dehydrogenase family enzyme